MNFNEFMKDYIFKDWNPQYADKVYERILDVATGNKPGNTFEREYLRVIKNAYEDYKGRRVEP